MQQFYFLSVVVIVVERLVPLRAKSESRGRPRTEKNHIFPQKFNAYLNGFDFFTSPAPLPRLPRSIR